MSGAITPRPQTNQHFPYSRRPQKRGPSPHPNWPSASEASGTAAETHQNPIRGMFSRCSYNSPAMAPGLFCLDADVPDMVNKN